MPARNRRPTAADVARLSGVSTATVSYVLNETSGQTIPGATRDRVLAAASELAYVPSAHAQALARGTSRIVLVDLSELPHGLPAAQQARDLATSLEKAGFVAIVAPLGLGSSDHTLLQGLASVTAPFAVITVSPLAPDLARQLTSIGVERLLSLASTENLDAWVGRSAREQVRHLHGRGHRRIGYWGPGAESLAHLGQERRRAAEQESERLGMFYEALGAGEDPRAIVAAVGVSAVTAVAAYNDEVAFAVLAALHAAGIRVPEDVAVIGVDDHPLAPFAIPALTTVRYRLDQLGTMDAVAAHLAHGAPLPPAGENDYHPTVVERASA